MKLHRTLKFTLVGLIFNVAYSAYHIAFGVASRSWWLFTVGVYYMLLSIVRWVVLRSKGKEESIVGFSGIMLMGLSIPLVGIVILSFVKDRGNVFHEITMIAIAVYTFTILTLAVVNFINCRRSKSAKLIALRNISFANALVSIFSLQRSMLVSFDGMTETEIRILNIATGTGVCVAVFLLGLNLLRDRRMVRWRDG